MEEMKGKPCPLPHLNPCSTNNSQRHLTSATDAPESFTFDFYNFVLILLLYCQRLERNGLLYISNYYSKEVIYEGVMCYIPLTLQSAILKTSWPFEFQTNIHKITSLKVILYFLHHTTVSSILHCYKNVL